MPNTSEADEARNTASLLRNRPGGLYHSWTKRPLMLAGLTLTDPQLQIATKLDGLGAELCRMTDLRMADEMEANPDGYRARYDAGFERQYRGLTWITHFVPIAVLSDEQTAYWWSSGFSRRRPISPFNYFGREHYYELVGISEEQHASCAEFFQSEGRRNNRRKASERFLSQRQMDAWERIRAKRPCPGAPTNPLFLQPEPDPHRLDELSALFQSIVNDKTDLGITVEQEQMLAVLQEVVQHGYSWAQLRKIGPLPAGNLTFTSDDPVGQTRRQVIRYAEHITQLLILTDSQVKVLPDYRMSKMFIL